MTMISLYDDLVHRLSDVLFDLAEYVVEIFAVMRFAPAGSGARHFRIRLLVNSRALLR